MNRNQIFTTIEFIDDLIRMCVGEYYNEKFYVFDTFKCQCNGLEASNIINPDEVRKTILELVRLIKEKTEIIVEEFILCMPSNNLIVNDFSSTSPVTGKNYLISQYDINESYKVASKIRHQDDEVVINICPLEYQLDDNQRMDIPPIRYRSTTFKTLFKVYMLPKAVYDSYLDVINSCDLKVNKYYLDVDCLYSGIFDEDDISASILNIDRYSTSLLLYKKGKLLEKISLPFGTLQIEKEIEDRLSIKDVYDLKNIIYNIGSCLPSNNNYLNICKNKEGRYVNERQVNEIIQYVFREILNRLFELAGNVVDVNALDVYITGYGANIRGIDKMISQIYHCNASVYVSSSLGLYNSGYCQTIGLIKLNYKKISQNKYINLQTNNYNDIIISKESNSKFDRFILDEEELD